MGTRPFTIALKKSINLAKEVKNIFNDKPLKKQLQKLACGFLQRNSKSFQQDIVEFEAQF